MHLHQERDRLAEDLFSVRVESVENKVKLQAQTEELKRLIEALHNHDVAASVARRAESPEATGTLTSQGEASTHTELDLVFKRVLERGDHTGARFVVEALHRLKLPEEASMSIRELASWRENKKTIVNSLRTLSEQIYSAKTRIIYELIQNADDCDVAPGGEPHELLIECSDEALIAYHNETGFQPKDLYGNQSILIQVNSSIILLRAAMSQVGESTKAAGSGKIGRKGIGFKSVFQITGSCGPFFFH